MIRGFRQIALLTVGSRILGMVRDMGFAYFLGAGGLMDGWAIAFKIPNLARRLFGEGAASASFIPVYSEQLQNEPEKATELASTVVTVVFVLLAIMVLVGEGIIWGYYHFFSEHPSTDLKLALCGIMLPYALLICIVAILAGILQSHRHFAAPAAAPMVLNIFIIASLVIGGMVLGIGASSLVFIVAGAVIIAGVVQLAIQLPPLRSKGVHLRASWQIRSEPFRKVIFLMGPMIIGLTVTQINTLSDDLIALWLSGSAEKGSFFSVFSHLIKYPLWEGAVSQLYYSQRLYQFPLGVLGISLATAIFPVMSAEAARKDFGALKKSISKGIRAAIFVAIPATAGLILVARPLVSVIFQHGEFSAEDSAKTSIILLFYAIGLCGYFCQQVLTRSFYAVQDSATPMKSAIAAVLVNIILNLTLIWFMGTAGLALSTAICSYLQVLFLAVMLRRRFGGAIFERFNSTLIKTVIATSVMCVIGAIVLILLQRFPQSFGFDIVRLAVTVPIAGGIYFLGAKFLGIEMLGLVTGRKDRRAKSQNTDKLSN